MWEKMPPEDQDKILAHCHAGKGKKVWLDADTLHEAQDLCP
jgi:hypothetical protein